MKSLEQAYEYCRGVMEVHSKTFSKAFSFLPEPDRKAVWAIYAFCRHADDIVDERGSLPELLQYRKEFDLFLKGEFQYDNPLWLALYDVFNRYEMESEPFYLMLEGQSVDLEKNRFETLEELERYSYLVASSVGLMLLPILAPNYSQQLKQGAIKLGIAMQITNILRDVGEDLTIDRIYLPKEIMLKHNYSFQALKDQVINEHFVAMIEDLAQYAESLYEEALLTTKEYPLRSRIPVEVANHGYRAILNVIRDNHYDVFNKRAIVIKKDKEIILDKIKASIKAFV